MSKIPKDIVINLKEETLINEVIILFDDGKYIFNREYIKKVLEKLLLKEMCIYEKEI